MELRRATEDQLEAAGRVTVEAYVGGGYLQPADPYAAKLADARWRHERGELWVALLDDAVVGTVTFAPVGSVLREISRGDEGEFRMLGVAPAARGRGVGQALVELCLRRSRVLGYAGVRMSTMAEMTAAHRVYERLGFARSPGDDWSPVPGVVLLGYALRF